MDGTIITMGNFTQPATAVNQIIAVPSGIDYLYIYNYTQMAASAGANGGSFYWQRGMGTNGLILSVGGAQAVTAAATAANAFTLYDPSVSTPGAAIAITNIDAATGIVLTGTTTGLAVGSIVRLNTLSAASAQQYGGLDFSVTAINPGVSFTIVPLTPSAAIGATTGFYRIQQPGLFYPKRRIISNITAANPAVVTTTVSHGFSVGQMVRFVVPQVTATRFGMTALDGLSGTITVVNSITSFTVDIDTSAMTAFAWPAAASVPFTPAEVIPYGDNTATALAQVPPLSSLEDSVQNTGYLGMILAAGALLPGGIAADVVYWRAGKVTMGGL